MANTYQLIEAQTLGSSAASITFSSIPATYTDLYLRVSTRLDNTDYWSGIAINGSTANFSMKNLQGSGTAASSASGSNGTLFLMANNSAYTANTFVSGEAYFPNYTSANYKSINTDSVMETNGPSAYMTMGAFLWSNTAAINSITLSGYGSDNFVQYSSFYLYGIKSS